jgi:hypothetical protein
MVRSILDLLDILDASDLAVSSPKSMAYTFAPSGVAKEASALAFFRSSPS